MPAWLSAILGVSALALTVSQIVARWGGRATRQDVDARTVEETARAVHRHEVADTATEGALKSLATSLVKLDGKLDQALSVLSQQQVAHAEMRTEARADRDRLARLEAESLSLRKEIHDVDERQSSARHALRGEIHSGLSAGVTEGLGAIRDLVKAIRKDSKRKGKAPATPAKKAA